MISVGDNAMTTCCVTTKTPLKTSESIINMDYHGEYILKAQKYKSNLLLYKKNAEKPTFQIDTNSWRAKFTLIELPNNVLSHAKMRKWTLSRVYDVTIGECGIFTSSIHSRP